MPKKSYDWEIGQPPPLIEEHTRVKQDIYQSYIEKYIKTLNQRPHIPDFDFAVVDAFAGGGLYLDRTGQEHQGSPVKIIKAIEKGKDRVCENRTAPFEINSQLFFIEKDENAFEYLARHLTELGYSPNFESNITLIKESFERVYLKIIESIIKLLGNKARTIFILDQYGYLDVPFACIREIFKRLPNAEVILTLSVDHLIDYISDPETAVRKAAQMQLFSEAEPAKKIDSAKEVNNYLGKIGLNIKELEENKALYPRTFRGTVQTKLLEQLLLFSNAKFYTPFFLSEQGKHREMWLVHLSNHFEARSVMTNIHWQYANKNKTIISHYGEYGLDMLGFMGKRDIIGQPELFEQQESFDFSTQKKPLVESALKEDIPKQLYGKTVIVKDFYSQSANHCLVSREDFLDSCKGLLQLREIEVVGKKGEQRRANITLNDTICLPKQGHFIF